ncbi:MAG TPA: MerR family transcriptional regulator [Acidimicrobiales bacterium]|nr:MerR family transcriptional regulator [Acidimicrobiales bacterium]
MSARAYLSIGEVLNLLKDEFPDITISKIRFLESQGLLDPERTPSGYRKFYEPDVERLRWILRQQKEHFLPLKVIRGRLEPVEEAMEETPEEVLGASEPGPAEATVSPLSAMPWAPARRRGRSAAPPPGVSDASLTFDELVEKSGLADGAARELERYGLIVGRTVAGTVYYDDDALAVARLAAGFGRFGVEARHLRMYKTAAEREAGFFEQIVTPLLKQRNPHSRHQAVSTVEELSNLGEQLRDLMLRLTLRDITGG